MVSGDCAESCWLLENVPADCAEHYYYDWGLETVQITPNYQYWLLETCAEHYWGLETVQSTPIMTGY